jgi:hypothetical protein
MSSVNPISNKAAIIDGNRDSILLSEKIYFAAIKAKRTIASDALPYHFECSNRVATPEIPSTRSSDKASMLGIVGNHTPTAKQAMAIGNA